MLLNLLLAFATYTDHKTQTISDYTVLCIGMVAFFSNPSISSGIVSAIALGSLMLLLAVVFPTNLGGGDVKLIAAYALSTNLVAASIIVAFAVLLCGIYGKIRRNQLTPLAPFLLFSHVVSQII